MYDLVGDLELFDEFVACASLIKEKTGLSKVSFPLVLSYMKKLSSFGYKAIRVWPYQRNVEETYVKFPDNRMMLGKTNKIQICFFDRTLLVYPYHIVYKKVKE